MRKILTLAALFASVTIQLPALQAQHIDYVDDEECGCELVFIDGIQTTTDGERYGFKNADGTQITPNKYRFVDYFHNGYCKVRLERHLCGLIDRSGREILPCIYDDIDYPSENRILVAKDGLFGYTDLNGNTIVQPRFINAGNFHEGTAPVQIVIDTYFTACTFIDTLGNQLFEPVFQNLQPFNEGYALAMRYDRWGVIDRSGREVLHYSYEQITSNLDGHFFAGDSNGWALFDYNFRPLTPFVYTWTGGISDGLISVRRNGKYGFLNPQGQEIIPCIYDLVSPFHLGRACAVLNGRYGIIDTTGRVILPFEYDNNTPHGDKYIYHDSLALVERNGKCGFVDLDGNLVIPFHFDQAFHFTEGLACTQFKDRWGYIDTHGDVFVPHIFQHASPMEWGRAEVVYMGNVSKMDRTGRCVKNCKGVIAWRTPTNNEN